MWQRIIRALWSSRLQFIKYVIVGISGVALDIGLLWLFSSYAGMRPVNALVISQILLLAFNFNLNKRWSFKNKGWSHLQLARYLATAGANYVFGIAFMWLFNERLGFNYLVVRLISIACMTLWNFVLYRYWIFPDRHDLPMIEV